MDPQTSDDFYGYLGRLDYDEGTALLRFYPFGFSREPSDTPIFSVRFHRPRFTKSDVAVLMEQGAEVEVRVREGRVDIDDIMAGTSLCLEAEQVVLQRLAYDLDDYVQYLATLDGANRRLHNDLNIMRKRVHRTTNFVIELLRRAEIKAASSADIRRNQTPAIEALNQILNTLEDGSDA